MRIRTIAKEYDGRWMIVSAIALAMLLFGTRAHAQIVSSNPLEYVALAEGNDLINGQIKHQIEDQQKTALLQNTIAAEFTQIHKWEKKYNSYLKTASGYASTLKACTSLYDDGVRLFINLCSLRKAIASNPQGIVATMSMNNLYIGTRHCIYHTQRSHSQGRQREHADRSRKKQNPLGVERPAFPV